MSKKIIVINIGWEQEPLLDQLRNSGYEIYGIHFEKLNYPFLKDLLVCDFRDLNKILGFAKSIRPDAVISDQCDYSHFAQAVVSEVLSLPGPTLSQAQISSNKLVQRSVAKLKGIKIPKFKSAITFEEAIVAADEIGFPLIIKPVDNRGSIGVNKVGDIRELKDSFFNSLGESHSRTVIIEQFVEGFEITVDGYCFNGNPKSLTLAKKKHLDENVRVAMEIEYPGNIGNELYLKAMKNNEETIKALGYTFGMTHAEYIVDKNEEIYLVEAANRGGGVLTSELIVPNVSGIDLVNLYIQDTMGFKNNENDFSSVLKNPTILKFFSFPPGKLLKVELPSSILNDPEVLKVKILVSEERTITNITSDANRHGFVILTSKADLSQKADMVVNKIKLTYAD
ncbi:ATP-grasp domain-containing protein [Leptospira santarosai]|uniref:ATP-grasp domain-containing protein n=1 Tax=Leptospira santarosai TaxID=28183 RepID=UPI000773A59F|nr:ATP-grasp domain-containing protein [Leptospira santarosai]MDI7189587.1 ATP-grasp domain-containing protein [Leptospira santarosai]MDI7211550.1 ATP-grasp domain-containing protein [Leptospira santarosai]MDI7221724.1 ATP-grasp domain-containing protein [Leptospira santarosai]